MTNFQLISAYDAKQHLLKEKVQIVDIRDEHAYKSDHIEDSFHLTNATLARFMKEVSVNTPVFVICYHGNSSKGVAQYLCEQGYLDVYSIEGGMVSWRLIHPHE